MTEAGVKPMIRLKHLDHSHRDAFPPLECQNPTAGEHKQIKSVQSTQYGVPEGTNLLICAAVARVAATEQTY